MIKNFLQIFRKKQQNYTKAPKDLESLLLKLTKVKLPVKYTEIRDVTQDGLIKLTYPLLSADKDLIEIKFFEKNSSFILDCFEIIDNQTLKVCNSLFKTWRIADTETPHIKKVKITYFTKTKNSKNILTIKNGELFIKSVIYGSDNIVFKNNQNFNKDANLEIDYHTYRVYYVDDAPTVLKDEITKETYIIVCEPKNKISLQKTI